MVLLFNMLWFVVGLVGFSGGGGYYVLVFWVDSAGRACFGGCLFRFGFGVVALLCCWFVACLSAVWVVVVLCLFVVKVLVVMFYLQCILC